MTRDTEIEMSGTETRDVVERARETAARIGDGERFPWWTSQIILREMADEIERLRSTSQAGCPEGWKLVPIEPTPEMLDAASKPNPSNGKSSLTADALRSYVYGLRADSYRAMLSASPPPPSTHDGALTIADYEEVFEDHKRLVRRLDVLLNGEAGAAPQASLCDIVGQLEAAKRSDDGALREALEDLVSSIEALALSGECPAAHALLAQEIAWAKAALASSPTPAATDAVAVEREALANINRRASPRGDRTFDAAISDLDWITAEARRALSKGGVNG
jgi:hypothetical protein